MPRNICQMAIKKRIMTAKVIGYMKPDIDPNTRLYVPFNEGVGDLAKDYSQYCNHAQLTDVEWSPGEFNGAGKFNGVSSLGDCGNDASLEITDAFTIEAWAKRKISGNRGLIARRVNGVDDLWQVQTKLTLNIVEFSGWFGGGNAVTVDTDTAIPQNQGYQITITYDKEYIRMYLNGKLDMTPVAETRDLDTGNSPIWIGTLYDTGVDHNFSGTIDNVIISSTARSAAQIAADCYEVVCN